MRTATPARKTLPARYYTDPRVFRDELERFYCGMWIWAGRADQIPSPGDYVLRDVAGESIIVLRDATGEVRAFFNVCRHRGTRMCTEGAGHLPDRIQCPYHGWTYALDGRLIGAPHMLETGGFSRDDYPLHIVRAGVWDGHIFIHLGPHPPPFVEQLADLPDKFRAWRMQDLRLVRRIVYDVRANWKLIVLNYHECLHCPVLHPALNRLHHYLGAENDPPQPTYMGGSMGFKEGVETMSTDGKLRRGYLPGLEERDRQRVCYYSIYPNLLLSLHPDYMLTHTLWPRAHDRTEVVCEWHFHPDEIARSDFHADDAIEFWDLTNREDWRISELSQLGISSRAYTPGPYSDRESLLHEFDRWVLEHEEKANRVVKR